MTKFLGLVIITGFLVVAPLVMAKNNAGGGANQPATDSPNTKSVQQKSLVAEPTLIPDSDRQPVSNQNQLQIKNQGEESQLQVNNQEQENLATDEANLNQGGQNQLAPRNEMADQKMSRVAQEVEELLSTQFKQGGIGEQVRIIAQEQHQAQEQIAADLSKLSNRQRWLKRLIGPDYQTLTSLADQISQNEARIQQLSDSQAELTDETELLAIDEAIQALTDQNTLLQEQVAVENDYVSVFGWLVKLFN